MKLVTKPVKSADENICGAKFSYTGSPSGVETAIGSQSLTFNVNDGVEYSSEVNGLFGLGAGVGTATVQLDYQTACYLSVYETKGTDEQDSANTTVSVIVIQGGSPLFTKSYSLRYQDETGTYVDTQETGVYSAGGFAITMPTKRLGKYLATFKAPDKHNLDCKIELGGLSSGVSSIAASLTVEFPAEDKAADFTTAELQSIYPSLKLYEGDKDFMYVDTKGHVTTGVGFMLASEDAAVAFPFLVSDNNPATEDQKRAEWRLIASKYDKNVKHTADWYEDFTDLYLADEWIDTKLKIVVGSDFSALTRNFTGFGSFPSAARIAIHDMYYNLGGKKLKEKFPSLMTAIAQRNWTNAAAESHRIGIEEKRNNYVRDLFLRAANPES